MHNNMTCIISAIVDKSKLSNLYISLGEHQIRLDNTGALTQKAVKNMIWNNERDNF